MHPNKLSAFNHGAELSLVLLLKGDASNEVMFKAGTLLEGGCLIVFVYCAIQYLMNLRCVNLCWTVVSFFVLGGCDCLWDLPLILFGAEVRDPKNMIQVPAPNTSKYNSSLKWLIYSQMPSPIAATKW